MITPLIFTDSTINSVRYKKSGYQSAPGKINIELSGYETGQAILARNNITFKNLATPVEVTDRYNKKTFSKDHLDLPNIHVYEYPDTNLQMMINLDDNIVTNDSSFLDQPQIIMFFKNNIPLKERDYDAEKILQIIFETELNKKSENVIFNIFENNVSGYSYSEIFGENIINNLTNLNNTIIKQDIDDNKINNAKNLINRNDISNEKIKKYYNKFIDNYSIKAFVTVSPDYYNTNKNKLLKILNDNFLKVSEKNDVPDNSQDIKQLIIKDISISVINSYKNFNNDYYVSYSENYGHSPTYIIYSKGDFSKQAYLNKLNSIKNENLENILAETKKVYKNNLKNIIKEDSLGIIKNSILAKYNTNIYNVFEMVNSVSVNNIKNFISNIINNKDYILKDYEEIYNESF